MSWLFGTKQQVETSAKQQPIRALPASWYHSQSMYDLERRAIFSKKWLLISHSCRFRNVGDYAQFKEAGFPFFIIKDRQGMIRAHHNICRHRAYPLVREQCGNVNILACNYHGWSYGMDGKLAKAPKYEELDGFDKSENGLFPIHIHVDKMGFIWANLSASEEPLPWTDDFEGIDEQERLQVFDMTSYRLDHTWEMMGDFNWKTLADNYNECYHCPTGHPGLVQYSEFSKYWVETTKGHIQHWNTDKGEGMGIWSSYYYPNASITISAAFMYIQRCVPISAMQTKMEYEVYRHKDATTKAFEKLNQIFKVVLSEDKELCNAAQKNLEAGIFINGQLHPRVEKGPLHFQQLTRELVMSHHALENAAGEPIWPATSKSKSSTKTQEEIDFCASLDCGVNKDAKLQW